MLTFRPTEGAPQDSVTKHTVQGLIYSHLWDTGYWRRHDEARFKFFTFSDIFPPGDFRAREEKSVLISSPDENFIEVLHERLSEKESLYLGGLKVELVRLKKFSLRPRGSFVTGFPVVVRSMNPDVRGFFTFYHEKSLDYFISRITENALSAWGLLQKRIIPDNRDFYAFLMDAGLGELNSLGFLNPIKGGIQTVSKILKNGIGSCSLGRRAWSFFTSLSPLRAPKNL